jgi:hypothetical protein
MLARSKIEIANAVIQWTPSHYNIAGNEEANRLAKDGVRLSQTDYQTSYEDAKWQPKATTMISEKRLHLKFNAEDCHFQLSRSEQVIILRLCTGHNKMRYHQHTKFKIGTTSLCHYGLADMTAEHILNECPKFTDL